MEQIITLCLVKASVTAGPQTRRNVTLQRGTIFKGCFPGDRLRSLIVAYATLTHSVTFSALTCNLLENATGRGRESGGGGGGLAPQINKVVIARNLKSNCNTFACLVY